LPLLFQRFGQAIVEFGDIEHYATNLGIVFRSLRRRSASARYLLGSAMGDDSPGTSLRLFAIALSGLAQELRD
jgi:hypothetical protein